jgi:hypothetical protein
MRELILLPILLLIVSCCTPDKPVAAIKPFHYNRNIIWKAYDCDCNKDIDYWQHYDENGKFGSKIYTKGNEGKCE